MRRAVPRPRRAADSLVSAARTYQNAQEGVRRETLSNLQWQDEAWSFYETLGEFSWAVTWLANAMSRVRLLAAEMTSGGNEPIPIESGPAVEIMERLGGGVGGQAALLRALVPQISVPGEGWVAGEAGPASTETWRVYSTDEIRPSGRGGFEVREDVHVWRPLAANSMVTRIWDPNPRYAYLAASAAKAALPIMRRIDLLDRRIIATLVSRLAMNGILLIPQEGTITVPEQYQDAPDPFVQMIIDIASKNIKNPGSASSAIPMPVKFSSELIEQWRHLSFGDQLTGELLEERDKELRRLATALNIPAEIILGMAQANHWCTTEDVEILTVDGWRTHDQLRPGDMVLTLNHDTGLSEWQPVGQVKRWRVNDHEMVAVDGRYHHSVTTGNHRWPVLTGKPGQRRREFTTSDKLGAWDGLANAFLVTGAPHADVPTEPKHTDALVEMVAWFFTEGQERHRAGRRTPQVLIYQSHTTNPDNTARIHRALTNLYGPPTDGPVSAGGRYTDQAATRRREAHRLAAAHPDMTKVEIGRRLGVSATMAGRYLAAAPAPREQQPRWRVTRTANGMTRFVLNAAAAEPISTHAPRRVVSREFVRQLTASQLELFLDTAIRADGKLMSGKTRLLGQKDPQMLEGFELAAILSGRSVSTYQHTHDGFTTHQQSYVSVRDRTVFGPRARNITHTRYTGVIWCPTTPNQTWLARHNGSVFFTGNTAWQLEESAIKMHISPVAEIIAHGLTAGYLYPMLEAAGLEAVGPNGGQLVVWYDTSELTARPDKTDAAFRAYDRLEASGDALRRETGLDEGDQPTGGELREQILKRLSANPQLGPYALDQLTGAQTPAGGSDPGATDTGGSESTPSSDQPEAEPSAGQRQPPDTQGDPPPPPGPDTPAGLRSLGWDLGVATPDREPPEMDRVFAQVLARLDEVAERLEYVERHRPDAVAANGGRR